MLISIRQQRFAYEKTTVKPFIKGPVIIKVARGGVGGKIVFYPKLFPDPYSIAPMFLGTPPFNHIKRFKGPPFLRNNQMVITKSHFLYSTVLTHCHF